MIIFAVYDRLLSREVRDGLMPHFDEGRASMHELYGSILPPYAQEEDHEQDRLRGSLQSSELLVVGFTGLLENDLWAINSAHQLQKPCGLILMTTDSVRVAAVSTIHNLRPFRFVISFGSVRRDKQIRELFPHTPYMWDITSLVEPGKQVAGFIQKHAA